MIILPTRKRLERRRDKLYAHLESVINCATIHQVEDILRQIHVINLRLRTYFKKEREPEEYFLDNEDNDIETQNTVEGKDSPSLEDILEIEEQIKNGKI